MICGGSLVDLTKLCSSCIRLLASLLLTPVPRVAVVHRPCTWGNPFSEGRRQVRVSPLENGIAEYTPLSSATNGIGGVSVLHSTEPMCSYPEHLAQVAAYVCEVRESGGVRSPCWRLCDATQRCFGSNSTSVNHCLIVMGTL